MTSYAFRIVNVFTVERDPFTGNPLCVFENAGALDAASMQALARQFNLSETTFLLPSPRASAGVRIFTPSYEMPFAGHPTLGTAHVCRSMGAAGDHLTLDMPAGIIPVAACGDRWTLQAPVPQWRSLAQSSSSLAAMLGVGAEDLDGPPLWVNAGCEQLVVPLRSMQAVRAARPRLDALAELAGDRGNGMVYVFASAGERVLARFFFQQGTALLEDPATGSATANLGGWLVATDAALPRKLEISQGEYTGRPCRLFLEVDVERRIRVSGDVLEIGRGLIEL